MTGHSSGSPGAGALDGLSAAHSQPGLSSEAQGSCPSRPGHSCQDPMTSWPLGGPAHLSSNGHSLPRHSPPGSQPWQHTLGPAAEMIMCPGA